MEERKRGARQEVGSLQCPRCGSNNTKFCYYNNYNTAQPRHFCRDCHRYWTQGGALRNIPAPGDSINRKRSRRSSTTPPTAPGPSKVPRIQADQESVTGASVIVGSAFASIRMSPPPPPPPPIFFGEGIGMVGAGFPLRPTLSLFNQGLAGLRGFQPFNPMMMPPPPPPLPLQLLHGLNMNQVLSVNAGEGSSANSAADDNAGDNGNTYGNINGGDLFVNQFFTPFSDGEGGETSKDVGFNARSADDSYNQTGAAATGAANATDDAPASPASFI